MINSREELINYLNEVCYDFLITNENENTSSRVLIVLSDWHEVLWCHWKFDGHEIGEHISFNPKDEKTARQLDNITDSDYKEGLQTLILGENSRNRTIIIHKGN